jgi:integrase
MIGEIDNGSRVPSPEAGASQDAPKSKRPKFNGKFTDAWVMKLRRPSKAEGTWYFYENLGKALGLRLLCSYGGKQAWRAQIRGESIWLGTFWAEEFCDDSKPDQLSCGRARNKVFELARNAPDRALEKRQGTFGEISRKWWAAEIEGRGLISEDEIERRLARYVMPKWESKPFGSIKRTDTTELLDAIQRQIQTGPKKAKGAVQVDAIRSTLAAIFTYMVDRMPDTWVPPIPAKRSTKVKRTRVLDDAELIQVWKAASDGSEYGRFVKFLPLVAQRDGKVIGMRRQDVKDDIWYIPKKDREKGTPKYIRLSPLALKILNEQLASHDGERIWNCVALSRHKREFDKRCPIPHFVLHDLRRSARTRVGKIKDKDGRLLVPPHIAERILGHTLKITDVQDTYDQADYSDEVSDALKLLSEHIAKVVGENIFDIKQAKRA